RYDGTRAKYGVKYGVRTYSMVASTTKPTAPAMENQTNWRGMKCTSLRTQRWEFSGCTDHVSASSLLFTGIRVWSHQLLLTIQDFETPGRRRRPSQPAVLTSHLAAFLKLLRTAHRRTNPHSAQKG